ncbi:MAG TPA: hypothetical protein PLU71_03870 [Candidatus Dependentiae bacterium]|nr:hypothetical protein [Candidatus Dependentiae bacterium]HRQ62969.1 hypothetical protein [Candidatus Dependentiae bacterium]
MLYRTFLIFCISSPLICMEKSGSSSTSETEENSFFSPTIQNTVYNKAKRHFKRSSSTNSFEQNIDIDITYTEKEYNLFCMAQSIVQIVKNSFQSREANNIHPSYRQLHLPDIHKSKMGLYLYFKDDIPAGLFTPWGIWNFWSKKTLEIIHKTRVESTLIRPHLDLHMITKCIVAYSKLSKIMPDDYIPGNKYSFGPILKIKHINNTVVENVLVNNNKRWIEQQKTWQAMHERYKAQDLEVNNIVIKKTKRPRSKSSPRDNSPKKLIRQKESPRSESSTYSQEISYIKNSPRKLEDSPRKKGSPRSWFNFLFKDKSE